MTKYTDKLKKFPLFGNLSEKDLDDFSNLLEEVKAPAGSD